MNNSQLLNAAIDFLFPPRCLLCECAVTHAHSLCAHCWQAIEFKPNHSCRQCGITLEAALEHPVCAGCSAHPPSFDQLDYVGLYNGPLKEMVHQVKFGDRMDVLPALSAMMLMQDISWTEIDYIVPVPLHHRRLWSRRYNQAAELARIIARRSSITMLPTVLKKTRHTKPQAQKTRRQRLDEVKNLYGYVRSKSHDLCDKKILLIDDVVTSGATAEACAWTLKKYAQVKRVNVLAVARVV